MDRYHLETFFEEHKAWLFERIEAYVAKESPTIDVDRVDELAQLIETDLLALGARLISTSGKPRLVAGRFSDQPPELCLIFHHDTVWPVGSFPAATRSQHTWHGAGIFDMKANLPLVMLTLQWLAQRRPDLLGRVTFLSSPDEETMGAVSREQVPRLAKGSRWALVFEPPHSDGSFKNRRKGCLHLEVDFLGIATHAGNGYSEGKSALRAAARFLLEAERQTDLAKSFTVNAGLLRGGSAVNTRPGQARMVLDIRAFDEAPINAFLGFVDAYRDPEGVTLSRRVRSRLPSMKSDHWGWEKLAGICEQLGLAFSCKPAGGGSDGSHLASMGINVLDGLGVLGAGEHAEHEHIQLAALATTFIRNTLLIEALLDKASQ